MLIKLICCFVCLFLCFSCGNQHRNNKQSHQKITDALQREVVLPDSVGRIVCIRSSAIRLVTYAGGASLICGIEEQESRPNEFTHIYAHPQLAQLPVIGPGMGGDAELIMAVQPDVIFMSSTTAGDADVLQQRTGIPVITLEYGDLGRNRATFYSSLQLIGKVLHTEAQVDTLIRFIDDQIAELHKRATATVTPSKVYVGGISYKGQKGITSTDPYYAALSYLNAGNVASEIDSAYISPITGTYIDWEQLIDWDPDVIFIDVGGWPLVKEELKARQSVSRLLHAYRDKQIYTLWPYNNHHTNFGVMLVNAWYAGKVLFPGQFQDISMRDKTNEIMTRFVGAPIADNLIRQWGNYQNIFDSQYP